MYLHMLLLLLSLQSRPTLCNPIDGSPPGSSSLRLSRQEYWSGLPFPSPMHESKSLSHVQLLAAPWTVTYQASPFMGFSKQEAISFSKYLHVCHSKFMYNIHFWMQNFWGTERWNDFPKVTEILHIKCKFRSINKWVGYSFRILKPDWMVNIWGWKIWHATWENLANFNDKSLCVTGIGERGGRPWKCLYLKLFVASVGTHHVQRVQKKWDIGWPFN